MTPELAVTDLACARGGTDVFAGVTFHLGAGALLVVRGPNGSGKSSLLRILGGLMRPSAGSVACRLDGEGVTSEDLARAAHLVGHRGGLTDAMTVLENLCFQSALLGGGSSDVAAAIDRVGLSALAAQRAQTLSAGQRRRLALARLVAVRRAIWLLDEPTESLDTEGERLVAALIDQHRAGGGIAVVATHGAVAARDAAELTLVPAVTARVA